MASTFHRSHAKNKNYRIINGRQGIGLLDADFITPCFLVVFFFPLLYMTNDVKSLFLYGPCFIRLMHMKKPAFNHFLTKMAIYMV